MKVIDLLNKIANSEITEEFDFKILDEDFKVLIKGYYVEIVNAIGTNLFKAKNLNVLSNEIEIIEEDKPIEKLDTLPRFETMETRDIYIIENRNKINELVDKVNKLGGNKDV